MKSNFNTIQSSKKGQSYIVEMIFVVLISITIAFISISIFSTLIKSSQQINKPYIMAWQASDVMLYSTGISSDWEENGNLSVLGLVFQRNIIAEPKLSALSSLNQENISQLTHLDVYNVSIEIIQNGNIYFQAGSVENSTTIRQIERTCVFANGTPCLFRLRISGE